MKLITAALVPATIVFAASLPGCDVQSSDASAGNASSSSPSEPEVVDMTALIPAEPASAPEPVLEPEPAPEP